MSLRYEAHRSGGFMILSERGIPIGHADCEEDARTFAAAAGLLEACEYALSLAAKVGDGGRLSNEATALYGLLLVAIGKARGRESAGMLPQNDAPNHKDQKGETFGEAQDRGATLEQMRVEEIKRRHSR